MNSVGSIMRAKNTRLLYEIGGGVFIQMKIINGQRYGTLFEVIRYWIVHVSIALLFVYGFYKFSCWLTPTFICQATYLPSDKILLPKTCHFINDYSMQEINVVCQRRGEKEFFECVERWFYDLDYDVCDDYYNLFMEEFQSNSIYVNFFF